MNNQKRKAPAQYAVTVRGPLPPDIATKLAAAQAAAVKSALKENAAPE